MHGTFNTQHAEMEPVPGGVKIVGSSVMKAMSGEKLRRDCEDEAKERSGHWLEVVSW